MILYVVSLNLSSRAMTKITAQQSNDNKGKFLFNLLSKACISKITRFILLFTFIKAYLIIYHACI